MKFNSAGPQEVKFSSDEIYEEIQKILQDPCFALSKILKRFLLFITEQTLLGQAHQLKEYTIAVFVLNKPKDFKPQDNGVVRVHAGRLRRALNNYYNGDGAADKIRILIPKGTYIPQFTTGAVETIKEQTDDLISINTQAIIGVIPFIHLNDQLINSFANGLCIQLSSELANIRNLSIVAYPVMYNLFKSADWKIASLVGTQYLIAGNIQSIQDQLRISVQLIETNTKMQMWGNMYERRIKNENIFELQDEISKLVIAQIGKFFNSVTHQSPAVA